MEFVNDMARMSLFHNLRTGNIIVDMIVSSMIAVVFSNIMRFNGWAYYFAVEILVYYLLI